MPELNSANIFAIKLINWFLDLYHDWSLDEGSDFRDILDVMA